MQPVDELMNQLRGVTGPEAVAVPEPDRWPLWLLAILGGVGVGAIVWFIWRRGRRLPAPDQEALRALARLPAEPSPEDWSCCEHIARRYLERQFGIAATKLTASELNGCVSDDWGAALTVLQTARFAPAQSSRESWSRLVQQLESFIQHDRLRPSGG